MDIFDLIATLFIVAALFAYLNHKVLKLPPAIGMMSAALVASMLLVAGHALFPNLGFTERFRTLVAEIDFSYALMHGMLSFLLFAGALHVDLEALKKRWVPIAALAAGGTVISTALVGFGMWAGLRLMGTPVALPYCMVFGALISPTDPVAVLGIMKAAGAPEDVEVKTVGESLFNDGLGVVIFAVMLAWAGLGGGHTEELSAGVVLSLLAQEVLGGVALGLASGFATFYVLRSLDEPYLEMLISVALVMLINLVAFKLHLSGPLAAVIAGLLIGNRGRALAMSERTNATLDTIWTFVDETLNALLFLLIGFEFLILPLRVEYAFAALLGIGVCLGARSAAVAIPLTLLRFRYHFIRGTRRILIWGGLKGGISVALALSLPDFEGREILLAITYAVVVSSILMQGLTIGRVIKRFTPEGSAPRPAGH